MPYYTDVPDQQMIGQNVPPEMAPQPQSVPADATSVAPDSGWIPWRDPEPDWAWHTLPAGIIYPSYLAGPREPRIGSVWNYERNMGWIWDIALGGRAGLLRYGNDDRDHPEGLQLDIEGAGLPRLDPDEDEDLVAVDFRFGIPLTYGRGPWRIKFGGYHLSSHLGDEFLLKNPTVHRLNYSRDQLLLGAAYMVTDEIRLYAESGWAFHTGENTAPWEFQFGAEYSPMLLRCISGAPFAAVNAHLQQEINYSGNLVFQTGWQWRGSGSGELFRVGVQYFTGNSEQYEFQADSEQKVGIGLWYDF